MLWLANAIIIVGLWLLGYKWRHAFLFTVAGEAIYVYWSCVNGVTEIAVISCLLCILAVRNWWLWRPNIAHDLRRSQADIKAGRLHDHEDVRKELG